MLNLRAQIIADYLHPFKDEIKSLYNWKFDIESKLNELINLAHKKLWVEDDIELFKTEMLLFSIADHQIIKDIIQKTTITIQ